MTPEQLIAAAEAKVVDAERNLAGCARSLEAHRARAGGVPNVEVIALAQTQAMVAQAYATLAMAKTAREMLAVPQPAPEAGDPE
ncbi:hypothetical protein AB0M54_24450 [Actinoplanes sp. NPDC051470]|uniref:hypothetical protein n=1 Tax=Actinoplanes sp. NPDC051470 TaxID=3157224 RepID=UPI003433E42F